MKINHKVKFDQNIKFKQEKELLKKYGLRFTIDIHIHENQYKVFYVSGYSFNKKMIWKNKEEIITAYLFHSKVVYMTEEKKHI
jgi:hypothetical protein